ncbi:MAG: zinc-dependent alcohol dehydrogenase family protein [Anaerolineae bacterium]|nr:zinc-dependent alcohol dehydrogenase family protein [Anaerolineae bacterium]
MKAARITAPLRTEVVDVADPVPGPGEAIIQVEVAGICGTDIHILQGEYQATYPLIPGHEFAGTVAAVGEGVTRFHVGDRVTADPNIACGRCPTCQRNEPNQCLTPQAVGVTRPGAFARYVSMPEGNVFSIGALPYNQAAFIEPLACVVWGLLRVPIVPGDSALIFGAGPMGCLLAQAIRHAGAAKVVVTDVAEWRLRRVAELGATAVVVADAQQEARLRSLASLGYDVVVDATGIPQVVEGIFRYARPRGRVWLFGVCPREATASFSPYQVFRKDLTIYGSYALCRTFPQSIALLESGAVQVESLISHQLPLSRFAEGLDLAQRAPDRMKVQLLPG